MTPALTSTEDSSLHWPYYGLMSSVTGLSAPLSTLLGRTFALSNGSFDFYSFWSLDSREILFQVSGKALIGADCYAFVIDTGVVHSAKGRRHG